MVPEYVVREHPDGVQVEFPVLNIMLTVRTPELGYVRANLIVKNPDETMAITDVHQDLGEPWAMHNWEAFKPGSEGSQ